MTKRLSGKIALVTGGGQGIGRAITLKLAEDGADVIIADLNLENAENVKQEVEELGQRAYAVQVDVRNENIVKEVVNASVREMGRIDILVNNAGVGAFNPFFDIEEKELDLQYEVNVKGVFFFMKAVAEQMVKQGSGKIVNLASQAGRRGEPYALSYCMSKAAVISITQSAALALARDNINVNAVAPGVVDTPFWVEVDKRFAEIQNLPVGEPKRRVVESIPLGRIEQPEDVAKVVAFLASSDADYMTGQTVNVDGGNVLS
ncbi:glucose 1-dehydrogenase [Halalkalibacter alkaliphilus]|uniref:Glucose 1-dehydrogenase n=1 Tax=Halalkalibacter alkaliphilus TaxID=2917993 RepID=A0A9X2CRC1_9BACI|nr:glucose 1-dehydrogenase [Halalkalibacter alkaliphilus]MCL7745769.1 glucose 1-dehydrogenase [Halalkalibacter alkaliphilus]